MGRVVLPVEVRKSVGLKERDRVLAEVTGRNIIT